MSISKRLRADDEIQDVEITVLKGHGGSYIYENLKVMSLAASKLMFT